MGTVPLSDGFATLTTSSLPVGLQTISASFSSGALDFAGSSGPDIITTVAGNRDSGYTGDGGPATNADLYLPYAVAVDSQGDLFIADFENQVIREVTPNGIISTVAGNGRAGYSGDGGPATDAELDFPVGVAVDVQGDLFIADSDNVIREVTPDGIISTVAGDGTAGDSGDGGPATAAELDGLTGVAVDAQGDLFIADSIDNVIRAVTPNGIITTVAGDRTRGYSGDGGQATAAELFFPEAVAVDAQGDLFIADSDNVIREVMPNGIITTVAGDGAAGYSGNGGPATAAELDGPTGLAVDAQGDLFIADSNNNVIREVTPNGIITTVAGNGTFGYAGNGEAATAAEFRSPEGVAVDAQGNLFIADIGNSVVRRVGLNIAEATSVDVLPATDYWINPNGGDWDTPSNWSTGSVPGPSDVVVIDLGYVTITHSSSTADAVNSLAIPASDVTLNLSNGSLALSNSNIAVNLTMSGGTLSTAGTLTVNGAMDWTEGTITGGGTLSIPAGASLAMAPNNAGTTEVLDGVALENAGTTTLGGYYGQYGLELESGAFVDNHANASFTITGSTFINGDGAAGEVFTNAGSFVVDPIDNGNSTVNVPFTQTATGTTEVQAGALTLAAGGTISNTVTVDAGTTFYLATNVGPITYELDNTSTLSGAGTVAIQNVPMVTMDGTYDITGGTELYNSTVTFDADATLTDLGSDLNLQGSTLTIASGQPLSFASVEITGSDVTGGGGETLTVTGSMNWYGGTLSGFAALVIPQAASLAMAPNNSGTTEVLDGVTLENAGTTTLGGYYGQYGLGLESGAFVDNEAGASFMITGSTFINGDGGAGEIFSNAGSLVVDPFDNNYSTINVPFTQTTTGTIEVQAGGLVLGAGGTISNTVTVDAGTTFYLATNVGPITYELDNTSTVDGAGTVAFQNLPMVTMDGTYDITGGTELYNSTVTFDADATLTDLGSDLNLQGSTLTIASGQPLSFATLEITGSDVTGGGGGTLTVTGSMSWYGGTLSGFAALIVPQAASLAMAPNNAGTTEVLDGTALENAGTTTLGGYYGQYGLELESGAFVDCQAGASLTITGSTFINGDGGAGEVFTNAGSLVVDPFDDYNTTINVPFTQTASGTTEVQAGALTLALAARSATQ